MELVRRDADYAVRALVMIACEDGFAQASEIARTQDVPFDFLQKILRKLKSAGIVKAKRGAGGGFMLSRPTRDIGLLSVIEAVQGPIAINRCFLGRDKCPRQKACPVHDRLKVVQKSIRELLAEVTLEELIGGEPRMKESTGRR